MKHVFMLLTVIALAFPVSAAAQHGSVTGKSGNVQTATPITSVATAGETTAGYQTESGATQERGISAKTASTAQGITIQPLRPDQAGQSQDVADTSAQAATRAEMYPGTTLGVDLMSASPSPVQSIVKAQGRLVEKPKSKPQEKPHK